MIHKVIIKKLNNLSIIHLRKYFIYIPSKYKYKGNLCCKINYNNSIKTYKKTILLIDNKLNYLVTKNKLKLKMYHILNVIMRE